MDLLSKAASSSSGHNLHDEHHAVIAHAEELCSVIGFFTIATLIGEVFFHNKHFHAIPGSGVFIIIGAIGAKLLPDGHATMYVVLLHTITLCIMAISTGVPYARQLNFSLISFTLYLLPPIIFDAGYTMKQNLFFKHLGQILVFALFGTLIATVFTGVILKISATKVDDDFEFVGWAEALAFGSIISAVDPVATLATFKALKVDKRLDILVGGESLINDACAVVLYRTFKEFMQKKDVDGESVGTAVGTFFHTCITSTVLGVVLSFIISLIFKYGNIHGATIEAIVFVVLTWTSFLLGEVCGVSGIICALFCGICCRRYADRNLSADGKIAAHSIYSILALSFELTIFMSVGYAAVEDTDKKWRYTLGFSIFTFFICLVARALHIFPLSAVINSKTRASRKISKNFQAIMWWGGLRGAIAVALLKDFQYSFMKNRMENHDQEFEYANMQWMKLQTVTYHLIVITVFVLGGLTEPLLKAMGIQMGPQTERQKQPSIAIASSGHANASTWAFMGIKGFKEHWRSFDYDYIMPFLVKDGKIPIKDKDTTGLPPPIATQDSSEMVISEAGDAPVNGVTRGAL